MNIIFFGTSEFAVPALRLLIQNDMIPVVVVTAPDKPKGRGQSFASSPVKSSLGGLAPKLRVLTPEKIDAEFIAAIAARNPNIGIVASYGKILPKALIELFPKGILNIHPSLLPKYRGPSPIQTSILNDDAETGVTIIVIDEKMDHGAILIQQRLILHQKVTSPPNPLSLPRRGGEKENISFSGGEVNYTSLHDTLAELGARLLIETLPRWVAGEIIPTPQDDSQATYTKLLKKEDGRIDWSRSAEEIERMVHAYNPWPGSYTNIEKVGLLKIKEASTSPLLPLLRKEGAERGINLFLGGGSPALPGTFFKTRDGFPAVVCGKNTLKLLVVQPENRQEISGKEFLRGHQ